MPERAVVDTSVLIALDKLGILDVLCRLYAEIILPETVLKEFGTLNLGCQALKQTENPLSHLLSGELNLGRAESEVIVLAKELGLRALIDDGKATRPRSPAPAGR